MHFQKLPGKVQNFVQDGDVSLYLRLKTLKKFQKYAQNVMKDTKIPKHRKGAVVLGKTSLVKAI